MIPLSDVIEDTLPPVDGVAGEKGGRWIPARDHAISSRNGGEFIVGACGGSVKMKWRARHRADSNRNSLLHRIGTNGLNSSLAI